MSIQAETQGPIEVSTEDLFVAGFTGGSNITIWSGSGGIGVYPIVLAKRPWEVTH